ncbi:MAG: hypothetical protein JWN39_437 [Ilumatobacteraceae bacterium]|nr:hypothetical protein [Ilumatobacteraceae bacterium]
MYLSAADEIRNLLHRYAELIDAKDVGGLHELFAHAIIDSDVQPGEWRGSSVEPRAPGVSELAVFGSAVNPRAGVRSAHVCSNAIIEFDADDRARARSRFTVVESEHGAPPVAVMCGRYEDSLELIDRRWRFVARRFFVDVAGSVS